MITYQKHFTLMTELEKDFIRAQEDLVGLVKQLRSERYLQMVDNLKKYLLYHFLGGLASGLGGVVGASLVFALIVFTVSKLQVVPVIGNFVTEVIKVVEENLKYRKLP